MSIMKLWKYMAQFVSKPTSLQEELRAELRRKLMYFLSFHNQYVVENGVFDDHQILFSFKIIFYLHFKVARDQEFEVHFLTLLN